MVPMRRVQSAMEYLVTYGWAILIILVAASFLYFYVLQPTLIAPGQCSFTVQIACKDLALSSNTAAGTANIIVLLGNAEDYPIANPMLFVSINGTNTSKVACSPGFVTPGGDMLCQIQLAKKLSINSLLAGKLYLNATNCGFAANYTAILACTSGVKQTYVGVFTAHAQFTTANTPVTILLSSSNGASAATVNTPVTIYATVKLLSNPIDGAVVNFTESSSIPTLRPQYATSSSTGVAITTIRSPSILSVTVTANSFGASNSISMTFVSTTTTTIAQSTTLATTTYLSVSSTSISSSAAGISTYMSGAKCKDVIFSATTAAVITRSSASSCQL